MNKFNLNRRYRIEYNGKGFSVWDRKTNRWIIDASLIEDSKMMSVSLNDTNSGLLPVKSWNFKHQAKFVRLK